MRYAEAIARSIQRRIEACSLDLSGLVVATECANDAYATTAAAALAAGAKEVWAYGRDSSWATLQQSAADVQALALALGAKVERLHVVQSRQAIPWPNVDLVTNSGHLRPLDAEILSAIPSSAVIALMFEAWELRNGDIDLDIARSRGISIFGVDEHHPACGSFEFVGALAVSEVMRQRWSLGDAKVAVISDNAFMGPVLRAMTAMGAQAIAVDPNPNRRSNSELQSHLRLSSDKILSGQGPAFDLAVVATTPAAVAEQSGQVAIAPKALAELVAACGVYGCIQLWGDIDRGSAEAKGVKFGPNDTPKPGHQAIAMNAAGYEATVRLQVGGLAAALHGLRQRQGVPTPEHLIGLTQSLSLTESSTQES